MTNPRSIKLFLSLGAAVLVGGFAIHAQQPTVKRETAQRAQSIRGEETYKTYCAVCHGANGKGSGPAAKALTQAPSDLTTWSQRHGRALSRADVQQIIDAEEMIAAHGSREMPVWGDVFRALYHDPDVRTLLVANLHSYLESLQAK